QVFTYQPVLGHLTTFGGHPVNSAAALATLEVLLKENYIAEVSKKEKLLRQKLIHSKIKELRTAGLWAAVEFSNSEQMHQVIRMALERGIILDWLLFNEKSLRIAPPLTITYRELQNVCDHIIDILDQL